MMTSFHFFDVQKIRIYSNMEYFLMMGADNLKGAHNLFWLPAERTQHLKWYWIVENMNMQLITFYLSAELTWKQ